MEDRFDVCVVSDSLEERADIPNDGYVHAFQKTLLHIDDGLQNIRPCKEHGIRGIVFDRPWNTGFETGDRIYRLSDLDEVA